MTDDHEQQTATEANTDAGSTGGAQPSSEDFYMDGPYLVFTAAYHLKRGFCCGSGCRHCPFDHEAVSGPEE